MSDSRRDGGVLKTWISRFCLMTALAAFAEDAMSAAPRLPLIAGGMLELGTGIMPGGQASSGLARVSPYLGGWVDGLGCVKVSYGRWTYEGADTSGVELSRESRHYGLQLGIALGGIGKPYVLVSYTMASLLSSRGDMNWHEWGGGLGAYLSLSPYAALVPELEWRSVRPHRDPETDAELRGSRLQFNLGLAVFLY